MNNKTTQYKFAHYMLFCSFSLSFGDLFSFGTKGTHSYNLSISFL